jgi:HK97 family phage prohead protease
MKINFPITLTAADSKKRTISGKIVSWDELGMTSAGATVFQKDSIDFSKPVKLLLEHDRTRPIGRLMDITADETGIEATFKVAATIAGDDSLLEAAEGLRDGFSVGVKINEWKNEDGVLKIKSSSLQEVSLVTDPAIDSARVTEVAASETPENSEATATDEQPQEEKVSENISEAPIASEAVEAAQTTPVVTANYVAYTKPRINENVTAGQFVAAQIKAVQGDTDARDLVAALQIGTVTENTGMVPPNYLRDVIGVIDSSRPFIDSIERAPLPASGLKIYTPVLGAQAIVGQTAEGVEYASQDTAVSFQEDNIVKFAGANVINQEVLDRSDPSFLDLLIRELAASYAQKTDAYAAKIAVNACGSTSASTIYGSIAKGIADSYNVMRFTPNRLMVAPSGGEDGIDFAGLLGAVADGRPLFAAAAPQNAGGLISQGSTNGTVAGLDLVVDPNYTGDDSNVKYALVYPSAAMRFHESGLFDIRANIVANGRVEIGLYGYAAVVNRYPTAFRGLTVSA